MNTSSTSLLRRIDEDSDLPVSERIRSRLIRANQKEAVMQLANILQDKLKPDGLAIVVEADHFCMHWRGVKDADSRMTNSVMRGSFLKDPDLRREFLSLLSKKNN